MERNIESMDLPSLKMLYERETDDLNASLMNGVSWNDLRDQRKKIIQIAMAIQSKRTGGDLKNGNPAESFTRPSE
jgi:hypothetical protein